jgi:hypothetical protein
MSIIAAIILRIILVRLNHKLDQGIYVKDAVNTPKKKSWVKGFRFKVYGHILSNGHSGTIGQFGAMWQSMVLW